MAKKLDVGDLVLDLRTNRVGFVKTVVASGRKARRFLYDVFGTGAKKGELAYRSLLKVIRRVK